MSAIDRSIPVPAYYQLKQLLKQRIEDGELRPGDRLPTEAELCDRYELSRTPVRQALQELVYEGLLIRTAGRGTFVAEPPRGKLESAAGATILEAVISDARWREPLEHAAELRNLAQPDDPLDVNFTLLELEQLRPYLIEAVGRGAAPDISLLDSVWVAEFAERHYLQPLMDIDPAWPAVHEKGFFAGLSDAGRYGDVPYAAPISADVGVLWYRRDWFAAEGLTPPATWSELVGVGRHFRQPAVRKRYDLPPHSLVLVGGRSGGETTTYQLLPFLWSAGGDLIAGDQVLLDSPQNREALAFLTGLVRDQELVSPDAVAYAWDDPARIFAEGGAAMAVGGTYESFFMRSVAGWDEATFLRKVGFVPIPAGPSGTQAVLVGGMSYVIYRQSEHANQALALLNLAGSEEVLAPFSQRTGHFPPQVSVARKLAEAGNGFLAQAAPLLEIARPRPRIPEFARVSRQFQALVEDCLTGRRKVAEAVPRTAELIAAITGLPLG
jgi:multiple sugar transport system substrate-binding protein